MKLTINSKVWDLIPVAGFFLLAAAEGKPYYLAGFLGVAWLTIIAMRWQINKKARKV